MLDALIQPILREAHFKSLVEAADLSRTTLAYAMADSAKPFIIRALIEAQRKPALIITATEQQALRLHSDLAHLLENGVENGAYLLPPKEITFYHAAASSRETSFRRIETMQAMADGRARVVIASADAALTRLAPKELFASFARMVRVGDRIAPSSLIRSLVEMGYERVDRIEAKGQCALRGGILDAYPPDSPDAVRIEFFDDELDSIRSFSTESQRSQQNLQSCLLTPATEIPMREAERVNAANRLERALRGALASRGHRQKKAAGKAAAVLAETAVDDLARMPALDDMIATPSMMTRHGTPEAKLAQYIERIANTVRSGGYPVGLEQFLPYCYEETQTLLDWARGMTIILDEPDKIRDRCSARYSSFEEAFKSGLERGEAMPSQAELMIGAEELISEAGHSAILFSSFMRAFAGLTPHSIIKLESVGATGYQGSIRDAAEDIRRWRAAGYAIIILAGGTSRAKRLLDTLGDLGIACETSVSGSDAPLILPLSMSHGFISDVARYAVLTDSDLYGAALRKARQAKLSGSRIASFTDLRVGDYVVHESHGVGMYKGTVRLQSEGHWRDYLYIQYQDSDKLYVPTDQLDRVQKYIGGDAAAPRLNRLGGSEWNRQKQKVRQSIREMAFDLVKLYAQRASVKGHAFSNDTPWQTQFEEFFPYEETPDQLQATEEIKRDMESETPMDRLLCGDVGYGKTEVALRAAFKAVMDGKQVALLAPTTVLTQQHYHTINERFQGFPIQAEQISRFKTAAQQREILKRVDRGEIDILVGTHRLLAKDVRFKALGLLIVDEEQRFGVAHKESIKNLRRTVDVLTLSATPIPRTLHMSMVGIRDMSLLETPPEERYPIQTYVLEYSEGLVRDAILRELARGGQVYMVYNHIDTIESMFVRLKDLVPEARIAVGHGQMREHMLEDVMLDFYDGRFDVLLCTTIIESGLDVPRANTLIVCESDHFGLAQLYQLRGRVGRSNRVAYAYLTLMPDRVISETADKRLQAIREFTEFGSGFRIAMRDLEIRGAGNLLGAEQHGFLSAVGYDMYCKLLEQTVKELRGMANPLETLETRIELRVDAYLPVEYVSDENQRIELYHRIAAIENGTQRIDLEDELTDRYGDIPPEANMLLDVAQLKNWANRLGVDLVQHKNDTVRFRFSQDAVVDLAKLIDAMPKADRRMGLEPGVQPSLILRDMPVSGEKALEEALSAIGRLIEDMFSIDPA